MKAETSESKDVCVTLRVNDINLICAAAMRSFMDCSDSSKLEQHERALQAALRVQEAALAAPLMERAAK